VNATLATVLVVLLAGILFLLPFLPALFELCLKRDGQPLNVIQQHEGDIRYFSCGFRNYVASLLEPLQKCVARGTSATGTMPDGLKYLLLGRPDDTLLVSPEGKRATCRSVVAAGRDVVLPDGITFANEVYSAGEFTGGRKNVFRSLFGQKGIQLQRSSTVIRWAHAVGAFRADHDCDLYGRVSSDREIQLQSGCAFQRLNAPRIALGRSDGEGADFVAPEIAPRPSVVLRRLVDEDLEIQPGEIVSTNLVTRGRLHIGAGARVLGSVKAHENVVLDAGVRVDGSLISASTMHIGPDCRISGPVIAEREMSVETGTRCGSIGTPTTVSAPTIQIAEGVKIFGTLWARTEGQVVPQG
jgi:cytoskeletal protein CcmA (bactofilin family)